MIVCSKCGHENVDGRQFCEACDEYLVWRGKTVSATVASLTPAHVAVVPGGEATAQLRIFNRGALVDKFSFDVPAELAPWVTIEPQTLNLYPDTNGQAEMLFRPPRSPEVRAGEIPFTINVRSDVKPDTTTEAAGTVTVEPFVDVAGRLVPNTSRSSGTAEYQIKCGNAGNATADISISVSNPDDLLAFQLESERVAVEPGEGTSVKLRVTPRDADQMPQGVAQSFRVTLAAPDGPAVTLDGSYTRVTRVELDGTLDPEASSSAGPAEYWITVNNTGNIAAAVALSASDPGQLLTFLMTPTNLTVGAGASARARLRVGLRQRGPAQEDTGESRGTPLPFQVIARAPDSSPLELNGTYTPLFVEMTATLEPRTSRAPETGHHSLQVVNTGNRLATVSITAADTEEALDISVDPPSLTIPPGERAYAEVWVWLRDASLPGAGQPHQFELQLTSDGSTAVKVEGAFVLLFGQLTAHLDPQTSEGVGVGEQWVVITNSGTLGVGATLSATDPRNAFTFKLNPDRVSLEPGETKEARLRVTPRRRPRRIPEPEAFRVYITSQEAPRVTLEGTRVQLRAPRHRRQWPGMLLRVLVAIALLVIGAVVAFNTMQMSYSFSRGGTTVQLPFVSLAAAALGIIGFLSVVPRRQYFIVVGVLAAGAIGLWIVSRQHIFNF